MNCMEWTEFCEKVSRLLEGFKRRLLFDYDNNSITYTIANQEYVYTIDEYHDLKKKAEQYVFSEIYNMRWQYL